MNRTIDAAQWRQIRGRVREQWGRFTDDEVERLRGHYDELVGKIQEKYGRTLDEAAREVNAFLDLVAAPRRRNVRGPWGRRKARSNGSGSVIEPRRSRSVDVLNDLIEVARDGERFYTDASRKVQAPELRGMFQQMADVRQRLIDDLGAHVIARGEVPSSDKTFAGTAQRVYADVLAALSPDPDAQYLARLEEAEDRLLQRYQTALRQPPSEEVAEILRRHEQTVWAAHDHMKALRDRLDGRV